MLDQYWPAGRCTCCPAFCPVVRPVSPSRSVRIFIFRPAVQSFTDLLTALHSPPLPERRGGRGVRLTLPGTNGREGRSVFPLCALSSFLRVSALNLFTSRRWVGFDCVRCPTRPAPPSTQSPRSPRAASRARRSSGQPPARCPPGSRRASTRPRTPLGRS